jgi:hypothetical protein
MISDYGVYPVPKTVDPHSSVIRFEEGEFQTRGNAFVHAAGLEVGSFFDDSAPPISAKMREYK